jgi:hypothetical protein
VILGYAVIAYMVYLIIVTARLTPKIWDPYEILGVSRVGSLFSLPLCIRTANKIQERQRKSHFQALQTSFPHLPPRQNPPRPRKERDYRDAQ